MTAEARTRIAIVDGERLFADAIAREVGLAGFSVVDVYPTIEHVAAEDDVDVVLVDPDVAAGDDEQAYEALSKDSSAKLILMSASVDYDRISRAVTLGYRGVVSKEVRLARLIEAVRSVVRGDLAIEAGSARTTEPPARRRREELIGRLTPREREVLRFLVEAASGSEIASRLSLSPHTVRTHINNVMHKLGVHSRSEAVAAAVRHGFASTGTDPEPPSSEVA